MNTQLSCSIIKRSPYQPRRHFDEQALKDLAESIRANRLLQPVPVRKNGKGEWELIAGERRLKAWVMIYGPDSEIPCVVHEMSDEESQALGLIENIKREGMSETEEAASAFDLVEIVRDKAEVCTKLGWSITKLESRLSLMRCAPCVREALDKRQIKLGIAELMAALTPEHQEKALPKIIAQNLSVAEVKNMLSNYVQQLSSAIFDKSCCAACPHNSSLQTEMFEETVGDGRCTHAECFIQQTNLELEDRLNSLRQSYPRVEFDDPLSNTPVFPIKVVTIGSNGVGDEQMESCKGCANFGATVSKKVSNLGEQERGVCFDQTCHKEKVKTHQRAAMKAAKAEAKTLVKSAPAHAGAQAVTMKVAEQASASKVSQRVVEYAEKVWRKTLYVVLDKNRDKAQLVLLWLAMSGNLGKLDSTKFTGMFKKKFGIDYQIGNVAGCLADLEGLPEEGRANFVLNIAQFSVGTLEIRNIKDILAWLNVDQSQYWVVNKEYLELLTKSEIGALVSAAGIADAITEDFDSLMKSDKAKIIGKVLTATEKSGVVYLPKAMDFRI